MRQRIVQWKAAVLVDRTVLENGIGQECGGQPKARDASGRERPEWTPEEAGSPATEASRTNVLTLVLVACVLLAGPNCGRPAIWPPEPAELHLGEESCAECRMLISEVRYAAQRRSKEGALEFFDDPGCLLVHRHGASFEPQGIFVVVGENGAWTRGDQAHLVQSGDFASPMGHGLMAFSSREAAEAQAARHPEATVMPLASLLGEGVQVPGPPLPRTSRPATP